MILLVPKLTFFLNFKQKLVSCFYKIVSPQKYNRTKPELCNQSCTFILFFFLQSTTHYFSSKVICNASNLLTTAFLLFTFAFPHLKQIMLFCLYTIYVSVAAPFKCQQNYKQTTSQFSIHIIVRPDLSAFIQASGR